MCIRCRTVDPWNMAGLELADRLASGGVVPAKEIREFEQGLIGARIPRG